MPHGRSLVCTCVRVCGLMWLLLQEVAEVMFMTHGTKHQLAQEPALAHDVPLAGEPAAHWELRRGKDMQKQGASGPEATIIYTCTTAACGAFQETSNASLIGREEDNVRHVTCFSFHFVPIGSSSCYAIICHLWFEFVCIWYSFSDVVLVIAQIGMDMSRLGWFNRSLLYRN